MKDCGIIDTSACHAAWSRLSDAQQRALQRLHTLPHWTEAQQANFLESASGGLSRHCLKAKGEILHLWTCPALRSFTEKADPQIALLRSSNTPSHILIGIPDKLRANTGWLVEPTNQDFKNSGR